MVDFDFVAVLRYWPDLLRGAATTLVLSLVSLMLGFSLSIVVALARTSRVRAARLFSASYVEVIRNTPILVQLFFIYFGLATLGWRMSPLVGAGLVTTINVGAYSTEIVRAGLEATPRGHVEAGLSLAMSRLQVFRHVMLRPALQRIYPALTSQFIIVMLGTSVASQIGAEELTAAGNFIQSRNFRSFEVFIVIGAMYLALALALRQLFGALGRVFVTSR